MKDSGKYQKLVAMAQEAMKNAYAPYSKFHVGAAVIGGSGKIYTGVNVENASFGATICAERSAIVSAVTAGERTIQAIAIASDLDDYIYPCGICRQVISEFADENLVILCSRPNGEYVKKNLNEILPHTFSL